MNGINLQNRSLGFGQVQIVGGAPRVSKIITENLASEARNRTRHVMVLDTLTLPPSPSNPKGLVERIVLSGKEHFRLGKKYKRTRASLDAMPPAFGIPAIKKKRSLEAEVRGLLSTIKKECSNRVKVM